MKKTIAILLVLVIGMVGVFAGTFDGFQESKSEDLTLTTSVSARHGLKIAASGITSETLGGKIAEFIGLSEVAAVPFTEAELSENLYVNYLNNQKGKVKVTTSMNPMVSSTGIDKIGYKVTIDGKDTEVAKGAENVAITFIQELATASGMRVVSKAFTVTMDSDEWVAASAGDDYTTTWTVGLTVE